jgi:hypothetical protein
MDFQQLLGKMKELDQPAVETVSSEECGMTPMMSPAMNKESTPPSMSLNFNVQGIDNIEQILQLITKLNPDAAPKDVTLPMVKATPSMMSMKPSDNEPESPSMDMLQKKEVWDNEPDEIIKPFNSAIPDGNDLNKPKKTFPKVAGGDNPMQKFESREQLQKQIREELQRRLAEAKGE